MKTYRIEIWSDWGPVRLDQDTVRATNFGCALSRGYRLAKGKIKRGPKVVKVHATLLQSVMAAPAVDPDSV